MPNLDRDPSSIQIDVDKMYYQNKSSYMRAWFVPRLIPSISHAGVKISFNPQQPCEKGAFVIPSSMENQGRMNRFPSSQT